MDCRDLPLVMSKSRVRQEGTHTGSLLGPSEGRLISVAPDIARLAAIVEYSGEPIITKDLHGIIQTWNKGAERVFGYRAEEIIGRPVGVLLPADRLTEEDCILDLLRQGRAVERLETVRVTKDGRHIPVLVSVSPIKDEQGRVIAASKIIHEIAEIAQRKRNHEERERLDRLVQAVAQARALPKIYEAAMAAIITCIGAERASILFKDSDGVMRFKAWRRLSEAYRTAVEGHSPWSPNESNPQPVCIRDTSELEPHLREVVSREGIGALAFIPLVYEGRLLGKFMVYYNQPHQFTENELRVAQTIASQIAFAVKRRREEEDLEELVQARTTKLREVITELQQISYAMTHDMRAPLRAMSTFAGLILEELPAENQSAAQLEDYCRRIIAGAARLDKLILDSLNYTKLVLQEPKLYPVELGKLIPGIIECYPNLNSGTAKIEIQDPLPVVLGEESLLTQCFSNLLGNAVKFVAPGTRPHVLVRVQMNCELARIIVQDNGIGIPQQAQNRLFGMFQRLTSEFDGAGIGLAIVRKVVERMGGQVGAESEPGKGSRFWVELRTVKSPVGAE